MLAVSSAPLLMLAVMRPYTWARLNKVWPSAAGEKRPSAVYE